MCAVNHRIVICLRTLKRSLGSQHLFRRKYNTDVLDIAWFVSDQLRESGGLHGYRWMLPKCHQAGFVTTRQVVYTIMQILDKDGVELRRKGGGLKEGNTLPRDRTISGILMHMTS